MRNIKCKSCETTIIARRKTKQFCDPCLLKRQNEQQSKVDARYYQKNREKAIMTSQETNMKKKYGIGWKEYERMLDEQNGVCKICSKPETSKNIKRLSIDHNHTTGKVRGLLCRKCNSAIGYFNDNITYLQKAIEYVK